MHSISTKITYWLIAKYFQRFEKKSIQEIRNHFRKLTSFISMVKPSAHHRIRKNLGLVPPEHLQQTNSNQDFPYSNDAIAKELFTRNLANILADFSYGLTHSIQEITDIAQPMDVDTENYLNEIKQQSGSVILSIHGANELAMAILIGHGIPTSAIYKPFAFKGLEAFSQGKRPGTDITKCGGLLAPPDAKGTLAMSRYIRRKGSCAVLYIDSIPRTLNAINVKLFNRKWSIPLFGINLAIKYKKPIYFITNTWTANGIAFKLTKITQGDNIDLTQVLSSCRNNFKEYLNLHWPDYYWQNYPSKSLSYLSDHSLDET